MPQKYLQSIRAFAKKWSPLSPPPQETTLRSLVRKDRKGMILSVPMMRKTPLEQGRKELQQGAYAEALIQFEIAVQKNKKNNWAWHGKNKQGYQKEAKVIDRDIFSNAEYALGTMNEEKHCH